MSPAKIFNDLQVGFSDLIEQLANSTPRLLRGLIVLILGIIIIRLLSLLFERIISYIRLSIGLKEILLIIVKTLLWLLLFVAILQSLGFSNVALALGGFAAAFTFGISQGLIPAVSDLVAGLQLANDHDFRVGDKVEVGTKDQRAQGYIIEMDTKKTRIISKDGNLHVYPNSMVDSNEWTLLERDEIAYEQMKRADIMDTINTRIKKGARK